jgi:hypothetical protein
MLLVGKEFGSCSQDLYVPDNDFAFTVASFHESLGGICTTMELEVLQKTLLAVSV